MSKKRPKKAPKSPKNCAMCTSTPKPRTGRILGYVAQKRIPRAPSPPAAPPPFMVSKPQTRPTRHIDPRTSGHLVQPGGSPARAHQGPPGSPGRKKSFFPKLFLDHLGCSNRCFWAVLSPWWRVLGHGKSQKCLENGSFWDQKWVKNGSKTRFSKNDLGPFMMLKQVVLPHFEPVGTGFGS